MTPKDHVPKARKVRKSHIPMYHARTKLTLEPAMLSGFQRWLGYEGGNGKVGLGYFDQSSNFIRTIMPNARVMVSGDTVNRGFGDVMHVPYAEFQGNRWGYSDAIWNLHGKRVDLFQGAEERYGSPEHIFPLLVMMAENQLPSGSYNLVVTVPPGYYNTVHDRVVQGFKKGDPLLVNKKRQDSGTWQITLSSDGVIRNYSFDTVRVIMEAADAGYAAFRWTLDGAVAQLPGADGQDLLGGRIRFIDLGFGTCDTPTLVDGQLVEEGITRVSDGRGGILTNIAQPIMDSLIEKRPEISDWLTPAHVDYWARRHVTGYTTTDGQALRPWSEESAMVSILGKNYHMASTFRHYGDQYARYVWRKVIEAQADAADTAVAIGGGWLYTIDSVRQWRLENNMPLQFVTHEQAKHLKGFSLIDINLIGIMAITGMFVKE